MPLPRSHAVPAITPFGLDTQTGRDSVDHALARTGFERADFRWSDLALADGEAISFPHDRARTTLDWRVIETPSLAEFKRWIGFDDGAIRERRLAATSVDLAGVETPESLMRNPHSEAARATLDKVTTAWLFGDSTQVAPYREAIEHFYGPFRAQLIVGSRIVLAPESSLRFEQTPVVFLADEVVLRGGAMYFSPVSHCTIGRLVKEAK